jgi:hypothetical protein
MASTDVSKLVDEMPDKGAAWLKQNEWFLYEEQDARVHIDTIARGLNLRQSLNGKKVAIPPRMYRLSTQIHH